MLRHCLGFLTVYLTVSPLAFSITLYSAATEIRQI